MSCLRLDQVYLYLEGELDAAGRRLVDLHLDCCPACRRAVEARRALHEAFLTLPPLDVPPDFSRRILDRIPARAASPLVWLAALASATGALLLVFLGAGLVTGRSLPAILVLLSRSLGSLLSRSATVLAKILEVLLVAIKFSGEFFGGLWKVLETLSTSFFPAGAVAPAIVLGLALTSLVILGMRRFLFSGGQS